MEIPFKYYLTLEDFKSNYKKDLQNFQNTIESGDEIIYAHFLEEKYLEIAGVLENFEMHEIEFDNTTTGRKSLSELVGRNFDNGIHYKDLGSWYNSKQEALNSFKNARIRIFSYKELEILITVFYYEENGNLLFNNVEFLRQKIAFEEILKLIEMKKSQSLNSTIEPLDFNLNQTDLIHFFDLLVDADIIKEPTSKAHKSKGGFYGKLAQYFTAKGQAINPNYAKGVKIRKKNKGTPYSESYFEALQDLKKTIAKQLSKG
ncbi:hypothetical protein [Muriicola sp. Z0-33]|uniref:hypothetical protein n=1 Tax=Muriicola sp. Z0-33 TaxID=2816957 RepID=UPI0022375D43|nr:hypothetical protein [Muriicola sp. Z0-33]MCW5516158.1 hypothetical protein [Muriicola sp. Z0-33]